MSEFEGYRNVVSVCISHEDIDANLPNFFCYTKGWMPFGRVKTRERVEYLADRRNHAVREALQKFPETNYILMVDSYYVSQQKPIMKLLADYFSIDESLVVGASTWFFDRTRLVPKVSFYDKWTTPDAANQYNKSGLVKVRAVGSCYIFPRSVWENYGYGLPASWTPAYGCEHNYLCEMSHLPVLLDYDAKLWRADQGYNPFSKRIRFTLGYYRWLLLKKRRSMAH